MPVFHVITRQRFDFKYSIIATKLFEVLFFGSCVLKLNYYNLNSSDEGF